MQGLELSHRFFNEWGLPFLQKRFPELSKRVAAGKIGGSDCLGADDDISRDHDWGPVFMLWLNTEDFREQGEVVRTTIEAQAPKSFLGYSRPTNCYTVQVHSLSEYFTRRAGIVVPPASGAHWMPDEAAEEALYEVVHGSIYYDPINMLVAPIQAFASFSSDRTFRLRRLEKTCFALWHYGEYNFCDRLSQRNDAVAKHMCLHKFIENVMRQSFYLKGDYCPYWKWMYHEFLKIAEPDALKSQLDDLVNCHDLQSQRILVSRICTLEREMLSKYGIAEDMGASSLFSVFRNIRQQIHSIKSRSTTWYSEASDRTFDRLLE